MLSLFEFRQDRFWLTHGDLFAFILTQNANIEGYIIPQCSRGSMVTID
jgi:hypothetical protein